MTRGARAARWAGALFLSACGYAQATTFVVTSNADTGGVCTATPASCTLRQAIASVNADVTGTKNFINFALPAGATTIAPATALPAITKAVVIDGYTQSGAAKNTADSGFNAVVKVRLSGFNIPAAIGLNLQAGTTLSGLAITGFSGSTPGNQGRAIEADSAATVNVRGCLIGVDTGFTPSPNHFGIRIGPGQTGAITIGGGSTAATILANRNLIAANDGGDIVAAAGGSGVVSVLGNLIGTNSTAHLGSQTNGININRPGAIIRDNAIAGADVGILLQDAGFQVTGNFIGDLDSAADANGIGIRITGNASGTGVIGGEGALANRLFRNATDGIEHSAPNLNVDFALNTVLMTNVTGGNRPFELLGVDGTDANDAGDGDTGPNGLQNSPTITSATRYLDAVGEPISISGTLNSLPNRSYRIAFHQSSVGTLGDTTVTLVTDGSGNGTFGPTQVVFPGGNVVQLAGTATLLDAVTSAPVATSEYGTFASVATIPPPADLVVNSTNDPGTGGCDAGECTLREAITAANANFNPQSVDVIRFAIPGAADDVHVITVASALPELDEPVTIDGYSQPGASANTDASGVASNAKLRIELRGGNFHFSDFVSSGRGLTVKGLSITGFQDPATPGGLGFGGADARVEGCWFGVSPDGTEVATNMVIAMNSENGAFGGDAPEQRNVFANRRALIASKGHVTNNLIGVLPDGRTSAVVNAFQPGFTDGSSGAVLLGGLNHVVINANVFSTPAGIPAVHGGNVDVFDDAFGESWDGVSTFDLGSAAWADIGLHLQSTTHAIHNALDDAVVVDSSNHIGPIRVDQPVIGGSGFGVFHSFGSHLSVRSPISGTGKIGINLDGGIEDEFAVTANIGSNVGPNDLQNYPELTSAQRNNNGITVQGTLQDVADTDFRIVVCGLVAGHPSGHGGCDEVLDDTTIVTTDAGGLASIDVVVQGDPIYAFVTATAARIITPDVEELTSEYALNIPIAEGPIFADGFEP